MSTAVIYSLHGITDSEGHFGGGRVIMSGRDSSVGIATRYGLDGPGIESRWGRDFSAPVQTGLRPTQPPIYSDTSANEDNSFRNHIR